MRKIIFPILVIIIVVLFSSIFVVQEGTRDIVLRFGKVIRDSNNVPTVYAPGLHFKLPFLDKTKVLDARIQTMNSQADRFVTKEKKDLMVDSYIKWRISDFSLYYLATGGGDIAQAETLLKRKFSDRLRSEIGKLDIKDIVTDSRGRLMIDVKNSLNYGAKDDPVDPAIASAVAQVQESKLNNVNLNSMAALGIEVVDVRIKQINLPQEVSGAIYERMRAERDAVARRHRSQGQEEAEKVRANADYQVTKTIAEAEKEARNIRGEGDATVAKLFADAFNQDPDFYTFMRSLQAYKKSFEHNNDVMVLKPDSEFFRFMRLSGSK